jgi:DNA-binding transcriptional LysR family regulator
MSQLDWFIRANLKPHHLQMMVALDDLRHLGRVAQSLHVSQPAVSLALGELEKGLGFKLFDRTPKGVVPNAYGESLIQHARLILGNLTQMRHELHALQSGASGKVHVGALPAMTPSLLPEALILLKQQTPLTSVIVQEGAMDSLLPELRRGTLDLVVGRLVNRRGQDDLAEEMLYEGKNVMVVAKGHPLIHKHGLIWSDLADYPWVLPPIGSLSREPLENALQQNGGSLPSDHLETLSIHVITGYVQHSQAIGLLSEVVAQHYINAGVLAQLPLSLPDPQRPIGMTWNRHNPLTPALKSFMDCVRKTVNLAHAEMTVEKDLPQKA